jgi:hypothetical protein
VPNFDPKSVDVLNALLLPVLAERVARLGEREAGAYNFYLQRLERRNLLGQYEIDIVRRLMEEGLATGGVHEVGPGYGQLPFLLALNGIEAAAIEIDPRRYATGAVMLEALAKADPEAGRRCRLIQGAFPVAASVLAPGSAAVLATNLVFTTDAPTKLRILHAMQKYRVAVLDVDRLFEKRNSDAEREQTMTLLAQAGYRAPEPFLDLGSAGRYFKCTAPA